MGHDLAVDWERAVKPEFLSLAGVDFVEADLTRDLPLSDRFDMIFSNHTLEHFSDPDAIISRLRGLLRPGGWLVSGLPLDGDQDDVFRPHLERWVANPERTRWTDASWLDPGHPWKTNAADVSDTLVRAGFAEVRLYQRQSHLTRGLPFDAPALSRYRSTRSALCAPWRALMTLSGSFTASNRIARKCLLGADFRASWGANRLKNSQSAELTFAAMSPA